MHLKLLSISILSFICIFGMTSAFANPINFSACASTPSHHCMVPMTVANNKAGTNEIVIITLPQNGTPQISGVLSSNNYSALQQNPAVMNVQFTSTSASPTLNYCPPAKIILTNQGIPEYQDRIYDGTKAGNLTHLVYPDYCFAETGPNPIDGSHVSSIPEFGPLSIIVLAIAVLSLVVFTAQREIRK